MCSMRPLRLFYLEFKPGPMKADIKLLKEVHLAEEERHGLGAGSRKDQSQQRKICHTSFNKQRARFVGCKISGERNASRLRIPNGAQSQSEHIRQHINSSAGIKHPMGLDGFTAAVLKFQRQERH